MLKQYFLKITTIVLLLLLCFPLPIQASSFFQPANEQVVNMNFEDNQKFYQELTSALQSGEPLKITTDFTQYSDLPDRLKDFLNLSNNDISSLILPSLSPVGALFAPNTSVQIHPDLTTLFISVGTVAGAAIGAGVGWLGGGIGVAPGGLIGAGIGAFGGLFIASTLDQKYTFEAIIETRGRLIILIHPT